MRPMHEILLSPEISWNHDHISAPVLSIANELIKHSRFDELGETLIILRQNKTLPLVAVPYVRGQVPRILREHLYRHPEITPQIMDQHWGTENMDKSIRDAIFQNNALPVAIGAVIRRLKNLSEIAAADSDLKRRR